MFWLSSHLSHIFIVLACFKTVQVILYEVEGTIMKDLIAPSKPTQNHFNSKHTIGHSEKNTTKSSIKKV